MNYVDDTLPFHPKHRTARPQPSDAEAARRALEQGNQLFAQSMNAGPNGIGRNGPAPLVTGNGLEVGTVPTPASLPEHSPFAVVVGCSDARVPLEILFTQGFNDLFVIRVAGNVLGDECIGSIDFALHALSDSVKVIVMLGHSGCGAVTGAVDAYLNPQTFWADSNSAMLQTILRRILPAVREADRGLAQVCGDDVRERPGFREVLIDASVAMNAAQTAYDMHLAVERAGNAEVKVLYGVFSLLNYHVFFPGQSRLAGDDATALGPLPPIPKN